MGVLAECPNCHKKQKVQNKVCKCGADLDKFKASRKVRYWISYYLPGGKQRREPVGFSIQEARDAFGKRKVQRRENRFFDMLPEAKITFNELTDWYLNLKPVKKLATYARVTYALNNFNAVYGDTRVSDIKPLDLENYQEKRADESLAPATIDIEISLVKTMLRKADDNDKVSPHVLKVFKKVKRMLKKGGNARKRTVTPEEYLRLVKASQPYLRPIIIVGYNTGMRRGEIRQLKRSYIDRGKMFIRLPAEITKEKRAKNIPINHHVMEALDALPLTIHGFVFTFRGQPILHKDSLKKSFETTCRQAGIPYGRKASNGITFHDIRRTVKTNMLAAGVDKVHRDLILGHSLQGMDVHYLAPSEESLTEAMGQYTKWLDDKIQNGDQTSDQNQKIL